MSPRICFEACRHLSGSERRSLQSETRKPASLHQQLEVSSESAILCSHSERGGELSRQCLGSSGSRPPPKLAPTGCSIVLRGVSGISVQHYTRNEVGMLVLCCSVPLAQCCSSVCIISDVSVACCGCLLKYHNINFLAAGEVLCEASGTQASLIVTDSLCRVGRQWFATTWAVCVQHSTCTCWHSRIYGIYSHTEPMAIASAVRLKCRNSER